MKRAGPLHHLGFEFFCGGIFFIVVKLKDTFVEVGKERKGVWEEEVVMMDSVLRSLVSEVYGMKFLPWEFLHIGEI